MSKRKRIRRNVGVAAQQVLANQVEANCAEFRKFMLEKRAERKMPAPGVIASTINAPLIARGIGTQAIAFSIIPSLIDLPDGIYKVTHDSSDELKEALTIVASYYAFDLHQNQMYVSWDEDENFGLIGLLYVSNKLALGGALLRDRHEGMKSCECKAAQPAGWAMQWAWIHSYVRRFGVFRQILKIAKDLVGEFWFEEPLSSSVHNYVSKYGSMHSMQTDFRTREKPCDADHSDPAITRKTNVA